MIDKVLDELTNTTNKFIEDVQKRAHSIVEGAVNISIDNGKKRLDELREMLKAESDLLEERIKAVKSNSIGDIEQRAQLINQRFAVEKSKIDAIAGNVKEQVDSQIQKLQNEAATILQNEKERLKAQIESVEQKAKELEKNLLENMEKKFAEKLDKIVLENRGLIIKSLIAAIFKRKGK